MLNKFGLAAVILAASAAPALADSNSCGSMPIPPAMPTAAEIAQKSPSDAEKAKHGAFLDIKNWQASLNDYRDCLNSLMTTDNQKIANLDPSKDASKIAALQLESTNAATDHDNTVDTEERVVNEFHAVQAAYCMRKDVDQSTCPK